MLWHSDAVELAMKPVAVACADQKGRNDQKGMGQEKTQKTDDSPESV